MKIIIFLVSIIIAVPVAHAQSDLDQIEGIFNNGQKDETVDTAPIQKMPVPAEGLSQLQKLEPYKDIAVIERRYLPKTNRFEAFGGGGYVLNDSFFNNFAANLRLSYYFREEWGIELSALAIGTSEKDVTHDLRTKHGVSTNTYVSPLSYYGATVKWSPFYGKISYLNHSIISFDHYFLLGGGITNTNQRTQAPTIHIGTGEIFALSKSLAFRLGVDWLFYQTSSNVSGAAQSSSFNNLYLTVGMSWFFPGAKYR